MNLHGPLDYDSINLLFLRSKAWKKKTKQIVGKKKLGPYGS